MDDINSSSLLSKKISKNKIFNFKIKKVYKKAGLVDNF